MKKIQLFLIINICTFSLAQTPCVNGFAGEFPCEGYDLQSQIPLASMNSTRANDSWGWTDSLDGKEYAILCLIEGTAFIDISDPINPVYLGTLPTQNNNSTWRDAKTYNNYAFIVSEDPGHGMQIFDLTRLRNVSSPPVIFTEDAHYSGFGSAHNIIINDATGYAYGLGTTANSGGPHFVNIQDPLNTINEGGFSGAGYCHDAQVVIYNGPDTDYSGREILFGSNADEVVIIDVTNKSNPQIISTIAYNNVEYTHQGWLSEDHRYFLLGDEQDEINIGINTRTIIFNFEDLDNPQLGFEYTGATAATDHNGYVKGEKFYLSNNAAGVRILNLTDISNGIISEEGYFDSYPPHNNSGYIGAWSVFPFFDSGNIVISDRTAGFLLIKETEVLGLNESLLSEISIFPNPVSDQLQIRSESMKISSLVVTDLLGTILFSEKDINSEDYSFNISNFARGVYFLSIDNRLTKKIIKK